MSIQTCVAVWYTITVNYLICVHTIYVNRERRPLRASSLRQGKSIVTPCSGTITAKRVNQSNGRGPRRYRNCSLQTYWIWWWEQFITSLSSVESQVTFETWKLYVSLTNFEDRLPVGKKYILKLFNHFSVVLNIWFQLIIGSNAADNVSAISILSAILFDDVFRVASCSIRIQRKYLSTEALKKAQSYHHK